MTDRSTSDDTTTERAHRAGIFDIRTFIGALLGVYGVILVLTGLFDTSDSELSKTDGVNLNLWAGLAMVAVSAFFLVWARLRPVVVKEEPDEGGSARDN
jgi:drug/metabolite transporter (DMT)-like permease